MKTQSDTQLAHGRTLRIEPSTAQTLEIRSPDGELELSITVGPDGPQLRVRAANIELEATHAIRMRSESLDIEVERDATIRARRGGVTLAANDDVDVKGERILLNADTSPMARTWEEIQARQADSEEYPGAG